MTVRLAPQPIHPFPARMAPEIALEQVRGLPRGAVILDPMTGSGTVPRVASDYQYHCLGFDTDPLAVLMAKVWNTPIDTTALRRASKELIRHAAEIVDDSVALDWIDNNDDTRRFVEFWFGESQRVVMRKIAYVLNQQSGDIANALKIAFSRIIVTKNKGASLARDVSHSRPHRVGEFNDFDVLQGFELSVEKIARRLEHNHPQGVADIRNGDARSLPIEPECVDAVITSPPYLNAIDYLRGHRLSLVWLGYSTQDISSIRSMNIGAERMPDAESNLQLAQQLAAPMGPMEQLSLRMQRIISRYVLDLYQMVLEVYRVLKPGGKAVFVIGNSCIRGVFVENDRAVSDIAEMLGFRLVHRFVRDIPSSRRYLPPPQGHQVGSNMEKRMRTETVLIYCRA